MSFRIDPVTKRLGKDIASMIYFTIWRQNVRDVNTEYHGKLLHNPPLDDRFDVCFQSLVTGRSRFWFNYRSIDNSESIANWKNIFLDAPLPVNYW